jgi:hypothetical protein
MTRRIEIASLHLHYAATCSNKIICRLLFLSFSANETIFAFLKKLRDRHETSEESAEQLLCAQLFRLRELLNAFLDKFFYQINIKFKALKTH